MLYDLIPDEKKGPFLKDLLEYVVERNGLASMPKQDMEACFIYLFKKHVDLKIDIYSLSKIFKVKEAKIKSLMELLYLKFDDSDRRADELKFLSLIENTLFEIESFEKVQIRFHFTQVEAFPLLQDFFRRVQGSVKYDRRSESIIVNQNRLYDVLNAIWEKDGGLSVAQSLVKPKIQKIIGNLGRSLDEEVRSKLREQNNSKFYKSLDYASKLSGIGSFVLNLYKSEAFKFFKS